MYWTAHSKERFIARLSGICTISEIENAIASKYAEISATTDWQAIVVVKTLRQRLSIKGADGSRSEGQVVVVAIDPKNMGIKTVMLRENWQINQKRTPGKLIK